MGDDSHDSGELPKKALAVGSRQSGIAGLTVADYRPQPADAVALVNANKATEERVLRILDRLGARVDIDRRWLAIGRTAIEQGFMAVNRAVIRSERVELPAEPAAETGWVIELASSSSPHFWGLSDAGWTRDPAKAMRFARELDAAAFARFYVVGVPVRICEHQWS